MAVVGSAYVIVRAISSRLKQDIGKAVKDGVKGAAPDIDRAAKSAADKLGDGVKDSVKKAAKDVAPQARSAGQQIGEAFGEAIPGGMRRRLGNNISKVFSKAWKQVRADGGGRNLGNRFISGFTDSLNKFKIPPKLWLGFLALPALGGVLKILAAYVGDAVSLISALGPPLGAVGVAGAAGIGVLGSAVAAVMIAFKGKSAELKAFKKNVKEIGKEFEGVGTAIRKKLLPRLEDALDISTKLAPTLEKGLAKVGKAVGKVAIHLAKVVTNAGNVQSLNAIFAATPGILKPLGKALGSIITIFLDLAEAGMPVLKQFVQFTAGWLKSKEAALNAAEASGRLQASIKRMTGSAKQVGRIIGNVFRGIGGILKAAQGSGRNLLGSMEKLTKRFDKWVNSDYGQTKLKKFFDESRKITREVNGLIGDILTAIGKPIASGTGSNNIVTFIRTLRTDVLPVVQDLAQEASKLAPKLIPLFKSFTELIKSMNDKGALGTFFETLGKIVDLMTTLFKTPVVGDLLGWGLAFLGMAKAINFVLKPIGGLKTILGPLGRLLFGTKDKAGLLTKAFQALGRTRVGGFFSRIVSGVKSIGSRLWRGAATAVTKGIGGIVRAIGGLAVKLAGAVGRMLSAAARLIPWKNLFTGGAAKVASGAARVGPWFAIGLGRISWAAVFKGIGKKIFGPLAAAITINDIGHALLPTVDKMAAWIRDKLPEPLANAFSAAYATVMSHPILRNMRTGTEQLFDNMWPDRFPWQDPIPPPNDGNLKRGLTTLSTAVGTAVGTIATKLKLAGVVANLQAAGARLNAATHGALGQVVEAIKAKLNPIVTQGSRVASGLVGALKGIFGGSRKGIDGAVGTMMGGILGIAKEAVNPVPRAVQAVMTATARAIAATKAAISGATRAATNGVKPTVRSAVSGLAGIGSSGVGSFARGMRSMVGAVGRAAGAAKSAARIQSFSLARAGASVIGSFVAGMRSRIEDVARAAIAATNAVLANKGPIEYDRVMLVPAGKAVIDGFLKGIASRLPQLRKDLRAITGEIPGLMSGADARDIALGIATPGLPGSTRSAANTVNNIRVYNPINEKTSQSLTRKNTRVGRIGAFA
jgi:hypothetical protein